MIPDVAMRILRSLVLLAALTGPLLAGMLALGDRAHAESGSGGGHGGSDGGDSGGGGGSGSGGGGDDGGSSGGDRDGGGGSGSGGSGDDGGSSGRGSGDDSKSDGGSGTGGPREQVYDGGWRERLAGSRYQVFDPRGRVVIDRRATARDRARFRK